MARLKIGQAGFSGRDSEDLDRVAVICGKSLSDPATAAGRLTDDAP
jgi:hypothetical protein